MAEPEKVIRGLERCAYDPDPGQPTKEFLSCSDCPYQQGCTHDLMRDALALLKAQMPRVMTPEEVTHSEDWLWYESRDLYQGWVKMNDCDDEWIDWEDCTVDRLGFYGSQWRCWTSRPTEEQRKAVKWDE